jgi:hypothetical protein
MKFALAYGEGMFGPKEAEETAAGGTVHNKIIINCYT